MPSSDSPSLPSLLSRLERDRDLRQRIRSATFDVLRNNQLPKKKLVGYIERMRQLAHTEHWLWDSIAELVHLACCDLDRLGISSAQCIAWIDDISTNGPPEGTQRCLSALIRNSHVVPPRIVYRWVDDALHSNADKSAALMLLAHDSYTHWSNLKTSKLCSWLEQSLTGYKGNHGVFRFFGVLVRRLKYVKDTAAVIPEALDVLANALFVVGRFDEFFFESLLDSLKWLRPSLRSKVRSHYLKLIYLDGRTVLKRRVLLDALAPATS